MSLSFLYSPGFCDSTLAPIPGRSCHGVSCDALMRSAASFSACNTCTCCYTTAAKSCERQKEINGGPARSSNLTGAALTFVTSRRRDAQETTWAPEMLSLRSPSDVATSTCGVPRSFSAVT